MRFSTVYRAAAVLVILVIVISNSVDLTEDPHSYSRWGSGKGGDVVPGIDTDGDGLKDIQEDIDQNGRLDPGERSPTDPFNPDTDGDGLDDGEEFDMWTERSSNRSSAPNWIERYNDDPVMEISIMLRLGPLGDLDFDGIPNIMDPDSDGDGIGDGMEMEEGSDPADPDTDGDTVPDLVDPAQGIVTDRDSDDMSDDWEEYHGVDEPDVDTDGDGVVDLLEYSTRRDPNHPDEYMGHLDLFTPMDLLGVTDPEEVRFVLNGTGARYIKLRNFLHYSIDGWSSPVLIDDIQRPYDGNGSRAEMALRGEWTGQLPYVAGTTGVSDVVISDLYPYSGDEPVERRGDSLWASAPAKKYTLVFNEPEMDPVFFSSITSSPDIAPSYLDIPPEIPGEVRDLAVEWVGEEDISPFDTAQLIARSLGAHCSYSRDFTNFEQLETDPAFRFLFMTYKGSSLDFASTFTILMRMNEIPCRMTMGYALGEEAGGMRTYRAGHLHLWSEIYLDGAGWIPFEVTPHSNDRVGSSAIAVDGVDPYVFGPNGGDGGGAFLSDQEGPLDPLGDEDGDRFLNYEEEEIGTDPRKADTDGDLLDDWREVNIYLTDPLDRDTDSDGLSDGEEVNEYLTDPLDPDTDNGSLTDSKEVYHVPPLDPLDPSDDSVLIDADRDGLTDIQEKVAGTNPLDNDTDHDLLKDPAELFTHRSDPLSSDTDGDGLSDHEEVMGNLTGRFSDPSRADTDSDNLTDPEEAELGTAIAIKDTDRDGLADGLEVLMLKTSPFDPDTDGDGILDGKEREGRTDPLASDSDGDDVTDGLEVWYGNNPNSDRIEPVPLDTDKDGLPDQVETLIGTSLLVNDTDGDGIIDGMEYKELHTDPKDNDTDGDGLDDPKELYQFFTDPLDRDTDGDNLTDREEIMMGTDPRTKDTDRDGLSDSWEVREGTDPLHPDTDRGGLGDGLEIMIGRNPLDGRDDLPLVGDRDGDGLEDGLEELYGTNITSIDSDGDGLLDGEEVHVYGTDPADPMSDEDQLDDGQEVLEYSTNPLLSDTDSDGLLDSDEVMDWGTDPLLNDTDDDGIPDGEEARVLGTDPLDPDSDGDGLEDGIEQSIIGTDPMKNDTDEGGALDGVEYDNGGDPLDPLDDSFYLDTDGDGLLDDEEDANLNGRLDQGETDPRSPDTDGDGIWDSHEVWGTFGPASDPRKKDTDNDTIPDGEEVHPGTDGFITDPTSNNTDGDEANLSDPDEINGVNGAVSDPSSLDGDSDGLSDLTELFVSHTDPLDPDTDSDGAPDGWIDGWRGRPENGVKDPGEYEDRNLDGIVDPGQWNGGAGPGETDPLDPDTDGGGVKDGDELFHEPDPFDPLSPSDDDFMKDFDGDGLTDQYENSSSTLWNDPDTDDDGLADGWDDVLIDGVLYKGERTGHNGWGPTDPNKADSDGDGLKDGEEVVMRTDPNDPDTDGDGLYDGYDVISGTDGRPHPGELTGRNRFDPSNPYGPTDPLNPDTDCDGLWDGEDISVDSDWHNGEYTNGCDPNDPDTDNDGLTDSEEVTLRYVESETNWDGEEGNDLTTDPLDPDTDGGGMPDGLEVDKQLNPLIPGDDDEYLDSDGDGLLNGEERHAAWLYFKNSDVDWNGDGIIDHRPNWQDPDTDDDGLDDGEEVRGRYGSNPLTNDTDGDGIEDREEVMIYDTDPTLPDTDDDGLTDGTEIGFVYDMVRSYVDWDGDGLFDNRTDPRNEDTDLDSLSDGSEAEDLDKGANPLDPGAPPLDYAPEEEVSVLITEAPSAIRKEQVLLDGSFMVVGNVKSKDGASIARIPVSILLLEPGNSKDTVISLEGNPDANVGTVRTDNEGSFSLNCVPNPNTPLGQMELFAVTKRSGLGGKLFLPGASPPVELVVRSDSYIETDTPEGPYSVSSVMTFRGSLRDLGNLPIPEQDLFLSTSWGANMPLSTGSEGYFSTPLRLPPDEGNFFLNMSYGGGTYVSGSSFSMDVSVVDGPVLILEPIPGRVRKGDMIKINGTLEGFGAIPAGEANITVRRGEDLMEVLQSRIIVKESAFQHDLLIDPRSFPDGPLIIEVLYEVGPQNIAVNGSLSTTVVDMSRIILDEPKVFRGDSSVLLVRLLSSSGLPLSAEPVSASFPEASWLSAVTSHTNISGWARLDLDLETTSPLGRVSMVIAHLSSEDDLMIGGTLSTNLTIVAETSIEVVEVQTTVTLLEGMVLEGRLIDDLGGGLDGEDSVSLEINGEEVATADTSGGGWFKFTHTVSKFTPRGRGLAVIRFEDLSGERSGWYEPSTIRWDINVMSRVLIQADLEGSGSNRTLEVVLRDETGSLIADAPVQIGIGFGFSTYRTNTSGNLTLELSSLQEGDRITVRYPGEARKGLLPSRVNITVEEEEEGPGVLAFGPYIVTAAVVLLMIGGVIVLLRFRRHSQKISSRRAREEHRRAMYMFSPDEGAQVAIYNTYKDTLRSLEKHGIVRSLDMTPDEFDETLRGLDGSGGLHDLGPLTRMFDEARYSDHRLSSHLIGKVKGLGLSLESGMSRVDSEQIRKKLKEQRDKPTVRVERPVPWKIKVDQDEELGALLGDKGVNG